MLALVVEGLIDQTYEQTLRSRILEPPCLSNVAHWGNLDMRDPALVSQPLQKLPKRFLRRNYGMLASSGLLITASDLALFEYALSGGEILNQDSLGELRAPYDEISIGQTMMGSFLIRHPQLCNVISVRGYQDWGDNAILNHYVDHGFIVAVVTSKGPREGTGEPYRTLIAAEIESILSGMVNQ